jgi:imidazoleglycerol phosphate dehydratase HisB
MNLRQAAEMALKYFEDAHGLEDTEVAIKEALRQALDLQTTIEKAQRRGQMFPMQPSG